MGSMFYSVGICVCWHWCLCLSVCLATATVNEHVQRDTPLSIGLNFPLGLTIAENDLCRFTQVTPVLYYIRDRVLMALKLYE